MSSTKAKSKPSPAQKLRSLQRKHFANIDHSNIDKYVGRIVRIYSYGKSKRMTSEEIAALPAEERAKIADVTLSARRLISNIALRKMKKILLTVCSRKKLHHKKTITAEDLIQAMEYDPDLNSIDSIEYVQRAVAAMGAYEAERKKSKASK